LIWCFQAVLRERSVDFFDDEREDDEMLDV
jgi:hypothetical protein